MDLNYHETYNNKSGSINRYFSVACMWQGVGFSKRGFLKYFVNLKNKSTIQAAKCLGSNNCNLGCTDLGRHSVSWLQERRSGLHGKKKDEVSCFWQELIGARWGNQSGEVLIGKRWVKARFVLLRFVRWSGH